MLVVCVARSYIGMILAAAVIAAAGLVQDSSVTLIAAMLLSPLMSPILAITFGLAIGHGGLTRRGLRNELIGVIVALVVGMAVGSVLAPLFGPRVFTAGELDPHRSGRAPPLHTTPRQHTCTHARAPPPALC